MSGGGYLPYKKNLDVSRTFQGLKERLNQYIAGTLSLHFRVQPKINMRVYNLGFHPRELCLNDGCYPPSWFPNKRAQ